MSSEPIVIETPKQSVETLPEGFEPIDPKTFKWEWGKQVHNQIDLVGLGYGWMDTVFTMTADRPLTFDKLLELVNHVVREFAEGSELFKKESESLKSVIIKDLHIKLFAYWYSKFLEFHMIDVESFQRAKEKLGKSNEHSNS
jgi:hypothetical protein